MLKFKHLCQVLKWKQFHHNYRTYTYEPYNVLFFGTDDYALHCLKRLKSDFEKVPGTHKAVKKLEVNLCGFTCITFPTFFLFSFKIFYEKDLWKLSNQNLFNFLYISQ